MRAQPWPLFSWWVWAQSAAVVTGTTVEGAALASVILVGVGSDNHCVGGSREVGVLFWTLFVWSAWAQPSSVVVDTTDEGAAPASVRMVGKDHPDTVVAVTKVEGASLASVRLVGKCSVSHCGGGH